MRRTLFLLALLFYTILSYGQFNITKYNKESFLIGTIDDYMGHQQTFTKSVDSFYYQMVDIYFQEEKNKALLIDSLFKDENPDMNMIDNGAPKGIKLYSSTLSKKIDQYYIYKPSGLYTIYYDTVYTGYLNKDMIKTSKQKLSFLAGVFFRQGVTTDAKEFIIRIPNSVSKAKLCAEFLKEFDCKNVEYKIMSGYIPVGHNVTFEPSEKIRGIIKIVKSLDK